MKIDIYFLIKDEKAFYLIHENFRKSTKGAFQCLYAPIILTDSIYRKYENYYPKVLLEKYFTKDKFFEVILMKNIMMKNV